jgi:transcription antitermination factor NusG
MLRNLEGRWCAVQVRPNTEYAVLAVLQSKGYEAYLPTYRKVRRMRHGDKQSRLPLFAGYLFCRFSFRAQAPIVTTVGVTKILAVAGVPVTIEDEEISQLQAIEAAPGVRYSPWPKVEVGDEVRICEGPLRGLEGVLRQVKGENRLIVSVPLMHRSVAVEIETAWIEPKT